MKRREQMMKEEAERKANAPDPDLPPGHRLMPEAERVQTLEKLKQSNVSVIKTFFFVLIKHH